YFEDATTYISGSTYSTIGLIVPAYNALLDILEKFIEEKSTVSTIKNAAQFGNHESDFQHLAKMARDFLAIQVERVFSSSKNLITDKQSNLNPETIRACISLKGWASKTSKDQILPLLEPSYKVLDEESTMNLPLSSDPGATSSWNLWLVWVFLSGWTQTFHQRDLALLFLDDIEPPEKKD
ncbi:66_t:CDS:2, partial [Dentiscutata erythropus]